MSDDTPIQRGESHHRSSRKTETLEHGPSWCSLLLYRQVFFSNEYMAPYWFNAESGERTWIQPAHAEDYVFDEAELVADVSADDDALLLPASPFRDRDSSTPSSTRGSVFVSKSPSKSPGPSALARSSSSGFAPPNGSSDGQHGGGIQPGTIMGSTSMVISSSASGTAATTAINVASNNAAALESAKVDRDSDEPETDGSHTVQHPADYLDYERLAAAAAASGDAGALSLDDFTGLRQSVAFLDADTVEYARSYDERGSLISVMPIEDGGADTAAGGGRPTTVATPSGLPPDVLPRHAAEPGLFRQLVAAAAKEIVPATMLTGARVAPPSSVGSNKNVNAPAIAGKDLRSASDASALLDSVVRATQEYRRKLLTPVVLSRIPLFRGLSAQEIRAITNAFTLVCLDDGDVVTTEGDLADAVFIVARGALALSAAPLATFNAPTASSEGPDDLRGSGSASPTVSGHGHTSGSSRDLTATSSTGSRREESVSEGQWYASDGVLVESHRFEWSALAVSREGAGKGLGRRGSFSAPAVPPQVS
jgi:hypothetical protein